MALSAGQWVAGRYEVEAFLGKGTFGEVYRVRDNNQGHVVALKLLDPTKLGPWPWHEPTQLTRLRSDYILPVWNADVVSGVPFVVTEVAIGGTVEDACAGGAMPGPDAVRCVRDAARGIARAHDDGIVHRDIKPDNLFVAADGHVMVGDFGLAHPVDAAGFAPQAGTPITSAPEVLAGGQTSVASDVYSLGATLYRLVTGEFPYENAATVDLATFVAAVAAGPPTPVRDLSPPTNRRLAQVVERAMARDPAARYASTAELDAALGRVRFQRVWVAATHPGHAQCWTSTLGTRSLSVCVSPNGARFDIATRHEPTGRRIRLLCSVGVSRTALAGRLRRVFERLGN